MQNLERSVTGTLNKRLPLGVRFNSITSYALVITYWVLLTLSFDIRFLVENPLYPPVLFMAFVGLAVLYLQFRWWVYSWLRTRMAARTIILMPSVVYFFLVLAHAAMLFIKSRQVGLVLADSQFNLVFHGISVFLFTTVWLVVARFNDAILLQSARGKSFIAKNGTLDLAAVSLAYWLIVGLYNAYTDFLPQIILFVILTFVLCIAAIVFINENLIRQVKIYIATLGDSLTSEKADSQKNSPLNPYYFENTIPDLLQLDPEALSQALFIIANVPMVDKLEEVEQLLTKANEDQKEELRNCIEGLNLSRQQVEAIENKYDFLERSQDLKLLRALIRMQLIDKDINVVIKALNDTRYELRKSAILVAGYLGDTNFIPILIDALNDATLCSYARYALIQMQDKSLKYLEVEFYKQKRNSFFVFNILKLLEEVNDERTNAFVLNNLYDPNRTIQLQSVQVIEKQGIEVPEKYVLQIKTIIENLIANFIFIQNIIQQIKSDKPNLRLLINSLNEEKEECFNQIERLLKTIYNPYLVGQVYNLLSSDDFFKKYFGLNFLELHFSMDLKNKIRHIFTYPDGSYDFTRVKDEFLDENLNKIYKSDEDIILDILKRDNNKIGVWTKACALMTFVRTKPSELNETIVAEFFHPNELLSQITAMLIYSHFIDEYLLLSFRLDKTNSSKLEYLVKSNLMPVNEQQWQVDNLLKFNKIFFLITHPLLEEYSSRELAVLEKLFEVRAFNDRKDDLFIPYHQLKGYWIIEAGTLYMSIDRENYVEYDKGDIVDLTHFGFEEQGTIHIKKKGFVRYLFIDELAFHNLNINPKLLVKNVKAIQPTIHHRKLTEVTMN